MPRRLLEHMASRIQGVQKKRWNIGNIVVNRSRTSYAVMNRTGLAVKE